MEIVIAKSGASKSEIIKTVGRVLKFPDYARDDNWDSFEECLSDALAKTQQRITVLIHALPTEGSPTAALISILTDLRLEHNNLSFLVGEAPPGSPATDDVPRRKQA